MRANLQLLGKNRDFRLISLGQLVAFLGTMFTSVALPYQIYHETHSTLMIGLLSLCQLIPLLFTALLGGALADRHHRQKLLLRSGCGMVLGTLILAINALFPHPSIALMFLASASISALYGVYRPAGVGLVQQIVAKEDFAQASSISSFNFSIGMIVGPAIGGLIIAHFGVATNFFVDAASFSFALFLVLRMKKLPLHLDEKPQENIVTSLKEGLKYAKSRQELLGTYYVDFIAMVFGMPQALFPAIAMAYGGAKTLGFLYAAPAIGALVISCVSQYCGRVRRQGLGIAWAASIWGIAIIFFGLSKHLPLMLAFLAIAGAADAVSGVFRSMMWNDLVPKTFRGRLAGIEMISYLSGPKLGDTEAGLVAAAFGVSASIISGGVLCIVGVVVCCYCLPRYYRYKKI